MSKETKRIVYRAPRAIDVAMMVAAITADHMALDKRVTAAKGDRSVEKIGDARLTERATASRAEWARRERWRGPPRGLAPCVDPSAAARCARGPPSEAPRAHAVHLPLGDTAKDRWVTPVRSDQSKAEGNSIH